MTNRTAAPAALPAWSVTSKRTARCHTVTRKALPAEWTAADAAHYGRALSTSRADVNVDVWAGEKIIATYRNGQRTF